MFEERISRLPEPDRDIFPIERVREYFSQLIRSLKQTFDNIYGKLNALRGILRSVSFDRTAAGVMAVPAKSLINAIIIEETNGSSVTGGINIGTTLGGNDVVSAQPVAANSLNNATVLYPVFPTPQSLYYDAVTNWNGAKVTITVFYTLI